jgi:hypothetical protein
MTSYVCSPSLSTSLSTSPPTSATPALVRFVSEGLAATIDSYLSGRLSLRRFASELAARIDTLAGLDAPARTVTRLRWLQRSVENLHAELALAGRTPTGDEKNCLTVTLVGLRTVLATLSPESPLGPAGAARPSAPTPPAIAVGGASGHRAATARLVA